MFKVNTPILSEERKRAIKEHLLSQIALPVEERRTSFVTTMFAAVSGFVMDSVTKANLKARILEAIEDSPQRRFFIANFFAFNKRLISSAMVFALVFGMFAFVNVDTRVVRAAGFTKLDDFSGGVLVEREGVVMSPYLGMEIREKDKIVTSDNGEAVISYFDDSVSRLASDSKLIINTLDDRDTVRSYVEVSLRSGVMWSRVVDLVESKSAFVVEAAEVYTKATRAAFNLSVDAESVEIGVFSNAVNVNLGDDVHKLVSGQVAIVEGDSDLAKVEDVRTSSEDLAWVQSNLESDKVHISEVEQRLLAAKMEAIGVKVDDKITYENSLRENALVFLTFDDVKKKQLELDLAEKKFIAAQVQLHDGKLNEEDKAEASAVIEDFTSHGEEFHAMIEEVAYTDEEYAAELKLYLEDKILASKKELAVVAPDSPLYDAKEAVEKLELATADVGDVAAIKSAQVAEKLSMEEEIDFDMPAVLEPPVVPVVVTIVEEKPIVEPVEELVVDNAYGVTVQGGKPLSPLF